ncbi:MAG TPA: magnesium transporter [Planctomycetota bacterium]|nr:magnesium transporter [Planctomycetota bacterium]
MSGDEERSPRSLLALLEEEGVEAPRLRDLLADIQPVDLAELLSDLDSENRSRVFSVLDAEQGARVFESLPLELKLDLVESLGEERLAAVLDRLPDETVEGLIDHLPLLREKRILARLDQDSVAYAPRTAAGRMTKNYVAVTEEFTAGEAIRAIQGSVTPETVSNLYVVDDDGRLVGVCGMGALFTHAPEVPVTSFMRRDVYFVGVTSDQQEAARLARQHRLRAVPVVDNDLRLVGVVTLRDLLDVVQEEAGDDMMRMAGSTLVDSLHTPIWKRFTLRLPWLYLTLGGELFIALVISRIFRSTLQRAAILAAFMPAIMATGGNVGLQSTTLIIRSLGMGTIRSGQVLRILGVELRLGLMLGLACGLGAAGIAMGLESGHSEVLKLGSAIFLAMVSATSATSVVGTLEPLLLHRLNLDPATACGPFVTMFNDLFGTTVYFLIATGLGFSSS